MRQHPPLWDELVDLRQQARHVGRRPLIVLDHVGGATRLLVTDLDDALAVDLRAPARDALFTQYLVEHVPVRRSPLFSRWHKVSAAAAAEGKRPLLVYKASRRPGALAAFGAWEGGA